MNYTKKESAGFVLVLLVLTIFSTITLAAASTADSFRYPLDTYKITGYRFGEYEPADPSTGIHYYHLGEDLRGSYPQPVYAIADGTVVQSQTNSATYGSVIVIQHVLPDGSQICSIYGHLSRQKGVIAKGPVTKGQIVGYIGTTAENGNWPQHLHFGIKKGAYDGTYAGRSASSSDISKFYKPSDFLNLIRAVGSPVTCRLSSMGDKIWVPSVDVMNSCGWSMGDIRPVTQTEMNNHATVSASLSFPAGTFIKIAGGSEISIIKQYSDGAGVKNRMRQPFSSWSAFIKAGGKSDQSNVRTVSRDEYYIYPEGKTL